MFTQPCFIMKNTSDIKNKLEVLGYKYTQSIIRNREEMLFANNGYFSNNFPYNALLIDRSIDCETNEDLFLALAALRDDTDKNQWFVYDDKDDNPDERQILWFICEKDDIRHDMWHDQAYLDCHKATVQELIQHFKDK